MFSPPVGTTAHFSTKGPATPNPMGLSPGTSPFGFILFLLFFTILPYICIPKNLLFSFACFGTLCKRCMYCHILLIVRFFHVGT